jgi:lysophospholipase L1-like esterase
VVEIFQFFSDIWVLGDSIPYWAGVRAIETGKPALRIDSGKMIGWWGSRGMSWTQLRHYIESQVLLSKPPDIIIINLGGNDLVQHPLTKIRNIIKKEIRYLRAAFPDVVFVWVDILVRLSWRGASGSDKEIDEKRKRINRWGRQQVRSFAKHEIVAVPIDSATAGFFRADGVHLSDVGLELYLDCLRDIILKYS